MTARTERRCTGDPDDASVKYADYDEYGELDVTCPRCHGDGADPMSDYTLACPRCGGEGELWWL